MFWVVMAAADDCAHEAHLFAEQVCHGTSTEQCAIHPACHLLGYSALRLHSLQQCAAAFYILFALPEDLQSGHLSSRAPCKLMPEALSGPSIVLLK